MGFWSFVNRGWNLPYLVLLGLVAVFLVGQLFGLLAHADAEADLDAAHGDAHADGLLALFGVGRVPWMVVWATFCLFAGFTGVAFNRAVFEASGGQYPTAWALPASLASATLVGLLAVRLFAGAAARVVDTGGRGATAKRQLAGRMGVVASASLDADFGEVRVRDEGGNELLVHARLAAGDAALARGAQVVLLDFDAEHEVFRASAPAGRDG